MYNHENKKKRVACGQLLSKADPSVLYVLPGSQSDSAISSLAKYPPTSTPKTETEQQFTETTRTDRMSPQRQLNLSFEEFDPVEEVVSDANEKFVSDEEASVSDQFKVPEKKQRGRRKQSTETVSRKLRSNTRKTAVDYTKYSDDEYDACKYPSYVD